MVDLRLRFRTLGALTGPIIATPLLLALTAASAAGVDEPIEAGATVLSADEARHADAEAYSARFDVSVEEALARLDQQSRLAEAAGSLEALEPERLAGAWIEHEPVFRLVVRFVGDDAGLVKFPGGNETGHGAGISWLSSGAAPASSGMWSKSRSVKAVPSKRSAGVRQPSSPWSRCRL